MSAVKSGLFSVTNKAIQVVLAICSMAILGRLLTPEDFGLFSLVLSIQIFFSPVLNLGLAQAYIMEPQVNQSTENAYHNINLIMAAINAIFLMTAAPLLAHFYQKPVLFNMTIFFSGSILLSAMSTQRMAYFTRQKRFGLLMIIDSATQFGGIISAIIAGVCGFGVWALLIRAWCVAFLRSILTRIISSQKYYNSSYAQIVKNVSKMRFGFELTISRILQTLMLSADKLFFGKFFDIMYLGFYTKAIETARLPESHISMAITTPAFSYLTRQSKKQRIINYKLFCNLVLLIAVIPAGMSVVIGDLLMPFIMGNQWIAAGVYLQLLGVWSVGKVIQRISGLIYMSEGETKKLIIVDGMAFPIVLGSAVMCAIIGNNPIWFVIGLSLSSLCYWLVILFFCLYGLEHNVHIFREVGKTFMTISILLVFVYMFRLFIIDLAFDMGPNATLFSVLAFSAILVFPIQLIFNRKQFIEVLLYIKRGLLPTHLIYL